MQAWRIVDAPIDTAAKNSTSQAAFANRDPAHVTGPTHRERDGDLEFTGPARAFDELRLGVCPCLFAVADESFVATGDTRPASYAFIPIPVKPEDSGTADALGFEHPVGRIAIRGQSDEILRQVGELLTLPPLAGLVDHAAMMPVTATWFAIF